MSFFTIIIPAYNCQDTINRLLDSIEHQNTDNIKVLIPDDSDEQHPNLFEDHIKPYTEKLNIEYYKRESEPYAIHCPGNTRHSGLQKAFQEDTEYIIFADCDDEFIPDTLGEIQAVLRENPQIDVLTTFFYTHYDETNEEELIEEEKNISWLHGKIYKKEFLKKHEIQFQINLASHEDVFFNGLIQGCLFKDGKSMMQYSRVFYVWHNRNMSESHYRETLYGEVFLYEHFQDWLNAAMNPMYLLISKYPDLLEAYRTQSVNNLSLAYCYFQGLIYNSPNNQYNRRNYKAIKNALITVLGVFGFTKDQLIQTAYQECEMFNINRKQSAWSTGDFIEQQSFKDFINDMNIYEE